MNDNMSPTGSRWNPTKEQMDLLENLYKQGIRTPSAEQIQQITMRLKAFGHIEGKNVFYWFQNHKARQRQKQKQDHIAYNFNRFLHRTCVFPPPCPKVVCSPYYAPQSDLGFYQQCSVPRLILPGPGLFIRRRAACDAPAVYMISTNDANNHCQENSGMVEQLSPNAKQYNTNNNQQTLNLFPLHPTGVLQERTSTTSSSSSSSSHLSIKENY